MQLLPDLDNPFECLWTKIITQNSAFFVATIYHPPDYEYNEQDLIEFLIDLRENQLSAVKQEFGKQKTGSKSWWSNVNSITSRKKKQDVSLSASLDPREINKYFQSVNTDPNYTTPEPLQISEGTRIPSLSIHEVQHLLLNQKRSSSGPDNLPYWFWKSFAIELAPIVTEIFNVSLNPAKYLRNGNPLIYYHSLKNHH
jgi:hypothetical protein